MAAFVNEPNKTNDPSYINTSQGTERASQQQLAATPEPKTMSTPDYRSDTTYGKLFQGIGDTLDTTVKGVDQALKDHIKENLYTRLDNIRDQFGVAQASQNPQQTANLAADASENSIPKAVTVSTKRLGNRLEGLREMYNNGDLQDSSYWARAEKEVTAVRAQYQGYRDYIDQKTSEILGTTPANALRRSLLQDVKDLATKQMTAADKQTQFEHQHADIIGTVMPNYFILKAQGKAPPFPVIESAVADFKARDYQDDRAVKKLNLIDKKGDFDVNQAGSVLADRLDTITSRTMSRASGIAGFSTFQDFVEKTQDKVLKGVPLNAEELGQVRNGFAQLRLKVNNEFDKAIAQPWSESDPNSKSFLSVMGKDPTKLKNIRDNAMSRINAFEKAISDNDTGLAGSLAASNEGTKNEAINKLYQIHDSWRKIAAARALVGDQATPNLITGEKGHLSNLLESLNNVTFGNVTHGGEKSFAQAWQRGIDQGMGPDYFKKTINTSYNVVLKGKDEKATINHATALFNNDFNFLERVEPSTERNNMYTQLTSPGAAKRMQAMRGTPEGEVAYQGYLKWSINSFSGLMKRNLDTLQDGVSNDDLVKIDYDPKTFQLKAEPLDRPGGSVIRQGGFLDRWLRTDYDTPVNEINKGLRNLGEIVKADGKDPSLVVSKIVSNLITTNVPKNPGLWDSILKAVKSKISNEAQAKPNP